MNTSKRLLLMGGGGARGYTDIARALYDVAYWPLQNDAAEIKNGYASNPVNATFGDPGPVSGLATSFAGNGYIDINSAALRTAINERRFSLGLWAYHPTWPAGVEFFVNAYTNVNNNFGIAKNGSLTVAYNYIAGATIKQSANIPVTAASWHHFGMDVDYTGDKWDIFFDGALVGRTSGIGAFAGDESAFVLGAYNAVPAYGWTGSLAHAGFASGTLTPYEWRRLANTNQISAVFFGDSITNGTGASDAAHRWVNLVAAARGWTDFVNSGISGTVLQNTVQNATATIGGPANGNGRDRWATGVNIYRPGRVLILYGLNDLRLNDLAFSDALYASDLGDVIDLIIAGGVDADNIVIGSPPYIPVASYALYAPWNGGTAQKHAAYVTAAAVVANAKGTRYVDVYQWMVDNGGDALLAADGIHPNDAGHAQIAAAFLSVI